MGVTVIQSGRFGGTIVPTDIANLALWLDADDASTFTYSSGSLVSQWNDKSGNARHLVQALTTYQPDRNGTMNGRTAVTFDGVDNYMAFDAGSDAIDVSPWTCWAVVNLTATADFDRVLAFRRSATGAADYESPNCIPLYRNSNTGGYVITSISAGTTSANSTGNTNNMMISSRMDGTNVYSGVDGTWSSATAATAPADMRYARVGGLAAGTGNPPDGFASNSLSGVLAELVFYNADLSAGDRSSVESYLRTKWGTP